MTSYGNVCLPALFVGIFVLCARHPLQGQSREHSGRFLEARQPWRELLTTTAVAATELVAHQLAITT